MTYPKMHMRRENMRRIVEVTCREGSVRKFVAVEAVASTFPCLLQVCLEQIVAFNVVPLPCISMPAFYYRSLDLT